MVRYSVKSIKLKECFKSQQSFVTFLTEVILHW